MMIITNEEELLTELKRQELLYGRLAELYHWGAKFWLTASIWFFLAVPAILFGNTRLWAYLSGAGVFFALGGSLIGRRAKSIERKEGLR